MRVWGQTLFSNACNLQEKHTEDSMIYYTQVQDRATPGHASSQQCRLPSIAERTKCSKESTSITREEVTSNWITCIILVSL